MPDKVAGLNNACSDLFLTAFWRMPTASAERGAASNRRVSSERSQVGRVFKYIQMDPEPRRLPSACSEICLKLGLMTLDASEIETAGLNDGRLEP